MNSASYHVDVDDLVYEELYASCQHCPLFG